MAVMTSSMSAFADHYLGDEPGINLARVGPHTQTVLELVEDDGVASPLIATMCWLVFTRTSTFTDVLRDAGWLPENQSEWRTYVVRHPLFSGEPRHDLLVLSSSFKGEPMAIPSVTTDDVLLENGFRNLSQELLEHVRAFP